MGAGTAGNATAGALYAGGGALLVAGLAVEADAAVKLKLIVVVTVDVAAGFRIDEDVASVDDKVTPMEGSKLEFFVGSFLKSTSSSPNMLSIRCLASSWSRRKAFNEAPRSPYSSR